MSEKQPIIVEFNDNRTGTTYTCNANFIEPYQSVMHDGYLSIQLSDVMAFDNGDGEPVNGVTISLAPEMRREWAQAIAGEGYVVVPAAPASGERERLLTALVEAQDDLVMAYRVDSQPRWEDAMEAVKKARKALERFDATTLPTGRGEDGTGEGK